MKNNIIHLCRHCKKIGTTKKKSVSRVNPNFDSIENEWLFNMSKLHSMNETLTKTMIDNKVINKSMDITVNKSEDGTVNKSMNKKYVSKTNRNYDYSSHEDEWLFNMSKLHSINETINGSVSTKKTNKNE